MYYPTEDYRTIQPFTARISVKTTLPLPVVYACLNRPELFGEWFAIVGYVQEASENFFGVLVMQDYGTDINFLQKSEQQIEIVQTIGQSLQKAMIHIHLGESDNTTTMDIQLSGELSRIDRECVLDGWQASKRFLEDEVCQHIMQKYAELSPDVSVS